MLTLEEVDRLIKLSEELPDEEDEAQESEKVEYLFDLIESFGDKLEMIENGTFVPKSKDDFKLKMDIPKKFGDVSEEITILNEIYAYCGWSISLAGNNESQSILIRAM